MSVSLGWLLSPQGRIGRGPYWATIFAYAALLGGLRYAFPSYDISEPGIVVLIAYPIAIWPLLSIQIKRWHDINRSGWFVLTGAVPLVGPFIGFVCNGILPGSKNTNRFGPPRNWRGDAMADMAPINDQAIQA